MKVLHVCQWDNPASGGAAKVAYHLVLELRKQGVDAYLLFVYGNKGWFGEQLGTYANHLGLEGSKDVWRYGWRLSQYLLKLKPDIIHHHEGLIWTYLFSTFLTKKRFVHGHLPGRIKPLNWRIKLAQNIQFFYSKQLICISQHTKQSWIDVGYPKKYIYVLPNGIDIKQYNPASREEKVKLKKQFQIPENKKVIGYVGRLHCIVKGTDDFLKTIAALPEDYYGLIAGDGQDEIALKKLTIDLGIQNRIKFLGSIPDSSQVFKILDAFLITSHRETFGLVLLEALACKVPVFVFKVDGGINEIISKLKIYTLDSRSHKAMKNLIINNLNEMNRDDIKYNDLVLKKKYSWESIGLKLITIYNF
jgi:glycosyltransferase involved in cell wall biosynthesis